jgi:uncharacterized Fe-S center protein
MKSPVYFAPLRAFSDQESTTAKVQRLFDRAGFSELIAPQDKTAIKLHFGETGSDGFISPVYVRRVVEKVRTCGALPFLTDTNTLYLGSRSNAVEHIRTAILHGFDYAVAGAPVIIADGLTGKNIRRVEIRKKHFAEVSIAGDIAAADSLIVLSHFKGHVATGFGGAIKNLAMGCAAPEGKRDQHNSRPFTIPENCTGCTSCVKICPTNAIGVKEKKPVINQALCIGCFECMHACPQHAIDIDWETEMPQFMERMVEYAYGALQGKENKAGFMNFFYGSRRTLTVSRSVMHLSCRISVSLHQPIRLQSMLQVSILSISSRASWIRFSPDTTTRAGISSGVSMPRRTGTDKYDMLRRSVWEAAGTISLKSDFFP